MVPPHGNHADIHTVRAFHWLGSQVHGDGHQRLGNSASCTVAR